MAAYKMHWIAFLGPQSYNSPKGDPLFTSHMTAPRERLSLCFSVYSIAA